MPVRRILVEPEIQAIEQDPDKEEIHGILRDLLSLMIVEAAGVDEKDPQKHHREDEIRVTVLAVKGRVEELLQTGPDRLPEGQFPVFHRCADRHGVIKEHRHEQAVLPDDVAGRQDAE